MLKNRYSFNYLSAALFALAYPNINFASEHVGVECKDVQWINSWWSPSRQDNFATSDIRWFGNEGDTKSPDYKFVRSEGKVLKNQKTGTVPLYSWYSPTRGDNFITSDPRWSGSRGDTKSPDYRFVRLEGYIYDPNLPKPDNRYLKPLYSFWSPSRGDNFATSDPRWSGSVGDKRSPDYTLYRLEGYLYSQCDEPLI